MSSRSSRVSSSGRGKVNSSTTRRGSRRLPSGENQTARRRSSGMNIFGNRSSNRTSSGMDSTREVEKDSDHPDPLDLGKDSEAASAPRDWLVVMGPRASGKTTLTRQLKLVHDGADVDESVRFVREAHKVALGLLKHVVSAALPTIADEASRKAAERLLALRRRVMITADVASDVKALWDRKEIVSCEEQLSDVQMRKACRHYVSRIDALADADYVPETLDLLHMAVPTVGQQDTRVHSFPGGQLSLFELTNDMSRSSVLFGSQQQVWRLPVPSSVPTPHFVLRRSAYTLSSCEASTSITAHTLGQCPTHLSVGKISSTARALRARLTRNHVRRLLDGL